MSYTNQEAEWIDYCDDCGDKLADGGVCERCDDSYWDDDYEGLIDGVGFADEGGRSALRASTPTNPRNLPCPTCGKLDRLTPIDRDRGYQCDSCADALERGGW